MDEILKDQNLVTLNKVSQFLKEQNLNVLSQLLVTTQTLKTSTKGSQPLICTLSKAYQSCERQTYGKSHLEFFSARLKES